MERWIRVVELCCKDPETESEFLKWFKAVHLPDLLASPAGMLSGNIYERQKAAPGEAKFIAIYEFETDDFRRTLSIHQEYLNSLQEKGRIRELSKVLSRRHFKKI